MERRKHHAAPANWQDFEDLCLKVWRPRLIEAKKNGRSGQPQAGVDIFGRDPKTDAWVGIQCKQKGRWPKKVLTTGQIEAEVEQAESFEPPLLQFIIATTAPRDVEAQEFVRELSDRRRADGKFSVDLRRGPGYDPSIRSWFDCGSHGPAGSDVGAETGESPSAPPALYYRLSGGSGQARISCSDGFGILSGASRASSN